MSPALRFLQVDEPDPSRSAREVAAGLMRDPPEVSPKFLYDPLGSRLFDAITELQEYYPTRTEAAIFEQHRESIAQAVQKVLGPRPVMIDLGAGNCAKAAGWFAALDPRRYVAVDISADFLRSALMALHREHPRIELIGVGLDFSVELTLPADVLQGPSLVFYPGSSIGNFSPEEARRLLSQARAVSQGGALLIGVDLVKPLDVLQAAYDDELGVTAAFNLNLLRHLNQLLQANFRPGDWKHVALFNEALSRIEMHLQARRDVQVNWAGGSRRFSAGQRLHTENSYKWTRASFETLLSDAGYGRLQYWTDQRSWFGVFLAS